MKLYSCEVMVCATVYVKASNEAAAMAKVRSLEGQSPAILDSGGDVEVTGLPWADPNLPKISLSPAMTIHGKWPGSRLEQAE